jgi:hypothetical protein
VQGECLTCPARRCFGAPGTILYANSSPIRLRFVLSSQWSGSVRNRQYLRSETREGECRLHHMLVRLSTGSLNRLTPDTIRGTNGKNTEVQTDLALHIWPCELSDSKRKRKRKCKQSLTTTCILFLSIPSTPLAGVYLQCSVHHRDLAPTLCHMPRAPTVPVLNENRGACQPIRSACEREVVHCVVSVVCC